MDIHTLCESHLPHSCQPHHTPTQKQYRNDLLVSVDARIAPNTRLYVSSMCVYVPFHSTAFCRLEATIPPPPYLPPRPARFLRKPSLEYILYDGNYKHMRSLCGTPLRPSSSLQTNDEIVKCLQKAVAQSYASEASLCASCACLVVCGCVRFPEACLSLTCVRASGSCLKGFTNRAI